MPKVIGIDPGLSATGVGIVTGEGFSIAAYSYGSVRTPSTSSLPQRLDLIFSKMSRLFSRETPDLVVIEDVFSIQKYPKSGITLGQVTGVILLAAARASVPTRELAVREAKQVLTGNGNASKQQLEKSVRSRLGRRDPIRPYHASDALGLALIGLLRSADVRDRGRQPAATV
jgi:crossover junction endodeoxyribonuclease RuvC